MIILFFFRILDGELVSLKDHPRKDVDESTAEEMLVGDIPLRIFNNAPGMPLNNADLFCDDLLTFLKFKLSTFL